VKGWLEAREITVRDIDPDGPAAEAGLRVGDVILDVNGKAIAKPAGK